MIRAKRPWTAEEDATLAKLAADGATADQIARRLRRPGSAIRYRARALALTLKSQHEHIGEIRKALLQPGARRDSQGSRSSASASIGPTDTVDRSASRRCPRNRAYRRARTRSGRRPRRGG